MGFPDVRASPIRESVYKVENSVLIRRQTPRATTPHHKVYHIDYQSDSQNRLRQMTQAIFAITLNISLLRIINHN